VTAPKPFLSRNTGLQIAADGHLAAKDHSAAYCSGYETMPSFLNPEYDIADEFERFWSLSK